MNLFGKEVGQDQVCPIAAKVSAITDFPVPNTRCKLHQLLGMTGYYCRFCQNVPSVVCPLTNLFSPSQQFVWSAERQQAFGNIKALLCCTLILAAPDIAFPFKLKVNACTVLLQE